VKLYEFKITCQGVGADVDQAFCDVLRTLNNDPQNTLTEDVEYICIEDPEMSDERIAAFLGAFVGG